MPKKLPTDIVAIQRAVKDPTRLEAVRSTGLLDTPPEEAFDELTRAASRMLGAPLAILTLVDEYRDYVKSQVGLPDAQATAQEITDTPTFCQLTVAQVEPLAINDTHKVPMLGMFPSVRQSGVRAHLGIPLILDGHAIGNCCVIDFHPRVWTADDIAVLTKLAAEATRLISLSKKSQQKALS
jgi:GAF domain-containing protein